MRFARQVAAVPLVLVGLVIGASCSSSGKATGSTGSGGASGAATTASTGGLGCHPACTAPQVCSAAGSCIDPGTCLVDGDCPGGEVCDQATKKCMPGGGCGQQEATAMNTPPNLLIVLDRSCSMTEVINGKTKWQIAVAELTQLMTAYAGKIRFGITLFPDRSPPNCSQGTVPFDPAPGNEPAIAMLLNKSLTNTDPYYPNGPCVTNIDTAVQQASMEPAFSDMTRKSFALLLTDGQQAGCNAGGGNTGTVATLKAMNMKGVPTFVIGFGSSADPVSLTQFANAGGVPNSGPAYYDATDQTALDAALKKIANETLSCDFKLNSAPPNAEKIYVFFNKMVEASDPTNGWTYNSATNTITFHGMACNQLKSGSVTDLQVIFGCSQPTPQ